MEKDKEVKKTNQLYVFFKILTVHPTWLLIYIFYYAKWIEVKEDGFRTGYYLVKRKWVWLLLFPIIGVGYCCYALYSAFVDIWTYDSCWKQSKKEKLDLNSKIYLSQSLYN